MRVTAALAATLGELSRRPTLAQYHIVEEECRWLRSIIATMVRADSPAPKLPPPWPALGDVV